ncbi:alkylphosphonate utilization protein [Suicoccus acidiformans]|uniref:Alkylphosphonate utilization protein n=1 Tax=Suicoccus acidiformans TaxID=2036206 RepID=A0A347WKE7_9LACT|nr:zinc ribbon domain-containing protein YjdM [Suicoccus acidiformans]AXY25554.1 alkylphosphonate utilization protein [Suicoccus acidiformans]
METNLPNCLQCDSDLTYTDGVMYICPICAHEWTDADMSAAEEALLIRDANGNVLEDGDTVTVIKDLKLSATQTIKQGTKVKGIRLVPDSADGHDIDAKVDGVGRVGLKSEFVKK